MLVGVQKKKETYQDPSTLHGNFVTNFHYQPFHTIYIYDILCNASFLTFAVMFLPLLMNFSLFLSYLSPVFHSFVAFCHLALVTVSFILCIMLCCDDDDDDDDDDTTTYST